MYFCHFRPNAPIQDNADRIDITNTNTREACWNAPRTALYAFPYDWIYTNKSVLIHFV